MIILKCWIQLVLETLSTSLWGIYTLLLLMVPHRCILHTCYFRTRFRFSWFFVSLTLFSSTYRSHGSFTNKRLFALRNNWYTQINSASQNHLLNTIPSSSLNVAVVFCYIIYKFANNHNNIDTCHPLPWASGLPVAIQCAWNLDPSVHWNATGECQCASSGLPVAFQWSSSVFQLCKLTLDRHWDTTGC